MLPGATLPDRCVKCNAPADPPTKERKIYWHHPAVYLLFLLYAFIYIIVALIVRKKAIVAPGLCAEHKSRRRNALIAVWTAFLAGFILVPTAFNQDVTVAPWTLLGGIFLCLGAAIAGTIFTRVVYPKRIDDSYVRLKGCGAQFLDSLPPFTY